VAAQISANATIHRDAAAGIEDKLCSMAKDALMRAPRASAF
jgi:hypothetical protein